tara:strand:- start:5836 stop:5988 length:153 start_codon:yes stop_codon:yes gene_type:complete
MEEDIVYNDVVKIERANDAETNKMKKQEEKRLEMQNRDPLDILAELGDDE